MSVDLAQLEVIVNQLQADAVVIGKIANNAANATNGSEEVGTVTTRLGDVVKNIQRVLSDITSVSLNTEIIEDTTTARTLAASDLGPKLINMNNASANTLNIPLTTSGSFVIGSSVTVRRGGVGSTTIVPAGSVTIESPGGLTAIVSQYSTVTLTYKGSDTWMLNGDLV